MNKIMVQQTYSPKSLENTPFHSKMTFLGVLYPILIIQMIIYGSIIFGKKLKKTATVSEN